MQGATSSGTECADANHSISSIPPQNIAEHLTDADVQQSPFAPCQLLHCLLGVTQFVDDALADGARVALLCGTNSSQEDDIGSAAAYAFGVQRARHMQIVNTWGDQDGDSGSSSSSREDEGSSAPADLNDGLAREAAAAQAKVSHASAALVGLLEVQSFRGSPGAQPAGKL